uniref:Uncharacterized protein n=1 Tax=Ditylenchus dipsaci TaxID=166011 RepID=A0A915EIK3_9BILA
MRHLHTGEMRGVIKVRGITLDEKGAVQVVPSMAVESPNFGDVVFMQDGAPPHWDLKSRAKVYKIHLSSRSNKVFSAIGPGKLYLTDAKQIESMNNGIELRPGLKKGVRIVSNNGKHVRRKTSPFFKSQNLLQTIKEVNGGRIPASEAEWTHVLLLCRRNSMHPNDRLANVMQRAEQLNIFSPSNKILSSFGVKVVKDSNEVVIGVRHPLKYSSETVSPRLRILLQ